MQMSARLVEEIKDTPHCSTVKVSSKVIVSVSGWNSFPPEGEFI